MPDLEVQLDSTETIVSYPPDLGDDGWLTAVDVRIRTPSTALPEEGSEESGTIDSVSTTLSSAAARGATTLALASGTGVLAGRRYAVELDGDPQSKLIVTAESISSTTLLLSEPLPRALASGAAFKGWAVSHPLVAAETTEPGQGLVVWRATIGGVVRTWHDAIWILKQLVNYTLTPDRLTTAFPIIHRLQLPTDTTLTGAIKAAWTHRLRADLEGQRVSLERIKSWDRLEPAHAAAVLVHLVSQDEQFSTEFVERQERLYKTRLESLFLSKRWWHDEPNDLAPKGENSLPEQVGMPVYTR